MPKPYNLRAYAVGLFTSLLFAVSVHAQTLTWLGIYEPPGYGRWGTSEARGVSLDGSTVVGWSYNTSAETYTAFRWTGSSGMMPLLYPENSRAWAVTPDGTKIVGQEASFTSYAFIWTEAGGLMYLPSINNSLDTAALAISPEGNVVVGWSAPPPSNQRRAVRWLNSSVQTLGTLGGSVEVATGVSSNGTVIVGWTRSASWGDRAFRWTEDTGMQILDLSVLGSGDMQALAVSADGTTIVGSHGSNGFIWTAGDGARSLGFGAAYAVSADGTVVVGGDSNAYVWTPDRGKQELNTLYAGLLTDGSYFSGAYAVSADGRFIAGRGYNASTGNEEAFLLDTYVECTAHNGDVDENGCVDDADLLAVLFAFGSTGTNLGRVDINCDQSVDDADLLIVLFNFGSGC
ncbi:MAG: hypothetical protein SNJ72_10960 [Fimbriimonadales bacterium]